MADLKRDRYEQTKLRPPGWDLDGGSGQRHYPRGLWPLTFPPPQPPTTPSACCRHDRLLKRRARKPKQATVRVASSIAPAM